MPEVSDLIADATVAYAEATGDRSAIQEAAGVIRSLGAGLRDLVRPTDTVRLAWASMIIRPDKRRPCLALVLDDRVSISWPKGLFRSGIEQETFARSAVTDVHVVTGTTGALRGVRMLAITHDGRDTLLGLAQGNSNPAVGVIRSAIMESTSEAG